MCHYELDIFIKNKWRPVKMTFSVSGIGLYKFLYTPVIKGVYKMDIRQAHMAVKWANKKSYPMKLRCIVDGKVEWQIGNTDLD